MTSTGGTLSTTGTRAPPGSCSQGGSKWRTPGPETPSDSTSGFRPPCGRGTRTKRGRITDLASTPLSPSPPPHSASRIRARQEFSTSRVWGARWGALCPLDILRQSATALWAGSTHRNRSRQHSSVPVKNTRSFRIRTVSRTRTRIFSAVRAPPRRRRRLRRRPRISMTRRILSSGIKWTASCRQTHSGEASKSAWSPTSQGRLTTRRSTRRTRG
mmetsp:Transcript_37992/g.89803  ORF Transcript_37992/g.89803 Transcript_37992/m.89803 type:complete len:215 (+) Transcript_37992:129-773(+)